MIEIIPCPGGPRPAIVCDACSRPVARAADAVIVPWASRTALVVHLGDCLDALQTQYPSTAAATPIGLAEALGKLVADLEVVEAAT